MPLAQVRAGERTHSRDLSANHFSNEVQLIRLKRLPRITKNQQNEMCFTVSSVRRRSAVGVFCGYDLSAL
jgi:hypothetical protein